MKPLEELAAMGAALGSMRFVQGPGGNVSIKDGDDLWVKASGKRLRDVAQESGYAKVSRALATRALDGDVEADAKLFAISPRPSLEAYFHLLGGRAVGHTHAFGALLYLCATDTVGDDLGGLLKSIPYVRPGRGVALAVRDVLGDELERAVALRSHGIIVYAQDAKSVVRITEEIDRRARTPHGKIQAIDDRLAKYDSSKTFAVNGGFARTLPPRELLSDRPRYLFPDAVVCTSVVHVDRLGEIKARAEDTLSKFKRASIVTDDRGERLICAISISQLEQSVEVLAAHDLVEEILVRRGVPAYLDDDEAPALLGMPSEQYRIQLLGTKVS